MSQIGDFVKDMRTPLYRNAVFLMANTVANNGFGFLFWMVVAWFYATSDFGMATALIAAAMLIANLSTLGLDIGLIRYLPEAKEQENSMINSAFSITTGLSIGISVIFLLGLGFWSPALIFLTENLFFSVAFIFVAIFFALSLVMNNVFIAKRSAKYMLLRNVVYGLVRLGLPAIFAVFFGVFGIFASWGVAAFIALVVGWLFFMRKILPEYRPSLRASKTVVNDIFHFSFGNYIGGILSMLPTFLLPIMLVNLATPELAAYFYVAWMIAGILFIVPQAVATSLFAEGSHFQDRFSGDIRKSLRLILVLVTIGIIALFFFGNILLFLFSADYSENAFDLLRILAISAVFVSINGVYFTIKRVEKKVAPIILISAFITIMTLIVAYVLVPPLGLIGVGIGWIASQGLVSLAIGILYLRKFLENRITTSRISSP